MKAGQICHMDVLSNFSLEDVFHKIVQRILSTDHESCSEEETILHPSLQRASCR